MADLKNVSCPSCHQKYRLPDSIEDRKVVCRACQVAFTVPGGDVEGGTGESAAEQSQGSFDGALFDSLDVDDLLNAKNSGLSQPRRESAASTDQSRQGAQKPVADRPVNAATPEAKAAKGNKTSAKKSKSTARTADPLDEARPAALRITVLDRSKKKSKDKKRKKKKNAKVAAAEAKKEAEFIDAQSDPFEEREKSNEPIDAEEQAVFDYVRAVNGRKNAFAMIVALAIAIALGGWFGVQEIERLRTPLTQTEREMLEDEGFRLKAAPAQRKGQFAALGKNVPRVAVVPGVRINELGQIDQRLADQRGGDPFDPNAAFGEDRQPPKRVKRESSVDLDTRIAAGKKTSSFSVGQGKVWGPALAVSARNVVFVPEGDGLAGYDLNSKKQMDYKSVALIAGKLDRISALAVTPDARFMMAGFKSGRVKLFQLDSQSRFFEITRLRQKHYRPIQKIVVSPDSNLFATLDAEEQLAVWEVETGENRWNRKIEKPQDGGGEQRCLAVCFSSDAQQLLVAMTQSDLVINTSDGDEVALKKRPTRKSAVLSPTNRMTISCTETEMAGFSIGKDFELWKKSISKTQAPITALDPSETMGLFFDGGESIVSFDLQTGDLVGRLPPVDGLRHQPESELMVSVDGQYLLSSARNYANGKLPINHANLPKANVSELPPALPLPRRVIPELWGAEQGKRSRRLTRISPPDSGKKISAVTINDDGLLFYSTTSGSLYVYDWTNRILLQEIQVDRDKTISALAICGKWLAAGLNRGGILLYEVRASGSLKSHGGVFGHNAAVVGIRAMPAKVNQEAQDLFSIASVSRDGNLRVWEIPTRGSLLNVETIPEAPKALVVLDDREILVASTSRLARVNPDTQKVSVEGSQKGGTRVALSPDGKKLAFVNRREIKIAKTRTGVAGDGVPLDQVPGAIQFTLDSRMLQIDFSKNVGVVNFKTGKTIDVIDAEIRPHTELETLFAVSPEGTLMAAVSKDGTRIIILSAEK